MKKFYSLKVNGVSRETRDTVVLGLELPEELVPYFSFQPGMYLTFRSQINGEELRRSYSLCSIPSTKKWEVAVKLVTNGRFSSFVHDLIKRGDYIDVMPPEGRFVKSMDIQHGKYVAFAGGSGITPIISIIESTLLNEPLSQFQLFYANKRSDNIIFKDRLEAIKNKFFDRFTVHYFFSQEEQESPLFQGRLDKEKCLKLNTVFYKPLEVNEYFLCGPFGMVEQVKEALLESGVKKEKIKFELFTNPGQDTSKEVEFPELHSETDFKSMSDIQVVMDSDTYSFSLNYYESNIIDEGIKKGYDFPYSCKGGVCSTCKAKVIEGEVKMDVCYALEDDEIENGYFLACQAHPRSKKLKISFDE